VCRACFDREAGTHLRQPWKAASAWKLRHLLHQRCGTPAHSTAEHLICAAHTRCLFWLRVSSCAAQPATPHFLGRRHSALKCQSSSTGRSAPLLAAMPPAGQRASQATRTTTPVGVCSVSVSSGLTAKLCRPWLAHPEGDTAVAKGCARACAAQVRACEIGAPGGHARGAARAFRALADV